MKKGYGQIFFKMSFILRAVNLGNYTKLDNWTNKASVIIKRNVN